MKECTHIVVFKTSQKIILPVAHTSSAVFGHVEVKGQHHTTAHATSAILIKNMFHHRWGRSSK